ncbi:MAG TPA: 3-ketoacyl-ACP reductase [Armatimonadota bacterium]|nr:3-ketoacyl-ACP reductase [Armatimonadota bacterium]
MKIVGCVTGAASGIGLAIAKSLAGAGYGIVAVDLRNDGQQVLDGFQGDGHLYVKADISSASDRAGILDAIKQTHGRLDLLVNNAGVAPSERKDVLETTEESYDRLMTINLKGPFFLTQMLARYMIELVQSGKVERPKIINISSISAYASSTSRGEYCISKAGVSMMTKLFADRLAEYGINVYEIRPGIIRTPMTEPVAAKYDKLIVEEGILPIKRWGYPEDVAAAVKAIVSGGFEYSTGQVFDVDGGFHLRRL